MTEATFEPEGKVKKPLQNSVEVVQQDSQTNQNSCDGNSPVDFETALDYAGYGKFNWLLMLLALPANCTSSFDAGALSFVLPVAACDLRLQSHAQKGVLNSAIYAGMICSALVWGSVSDILGRRKLLVAGFFADAVIFILSSFANSYWLMIFFRFCAGCVIFGPYTIFTTYIAELFGSKYRDLAVIANGFFFTFGTILQPGLASLLIPLKIYYELPFGIQLNSWRVFLLVCSIPSFVAGIAMSFSVESPKFLMNQGRKEEALQVLKKIYTSNTGHPPNTYPITNLIDLNKHPVKKNTSTTNKQMWAVFGLFKQIREVISAPFILRTIWSFSLQFCLLATVDVMRLWLPQLFSDMRNFYAKNEESSNKTTLCSQLPVNTEGPLYFETGCKSVNVEAVVYTNVMIVYGVVLLFNILTSIGIHFISKRAMLVGTAGVSAVIIFLVPMLDTFYVLPLAAIFIGILTAYFYVHISVVVEIFPTRLRATGMSLTIMFCRMGAFMSSILSTRLLYINCQMVFYIFTGILICMAIGSYFVPPADEEEKTVDQKCDTD